MALTQELEGPKPQVKNVAVMLRDSVLIDGSLLTRGTRSTERSNLGDTRHSPTASCTGSARASDATRPAIQRRGRSGRIKPGSSPMR